MSAALDLRSKEQKDAELDKRIEALRKKNEALIRRYQEIEEDRRKAEQEGVAVTSGPRRAHRPERRDAGGPGHGPPGPSEKRVVKDKKPSGTPKPRRGSGRSGLGPPGHSTWGDPQDSPWEGAPGQGDRGGGRGRRSRGRGATSPGLGGDTGPDWKSKEWEERRRQNIEKMNEEMEKIAEYERNQRDGLHEKNPVRNFLDDPRRSGPFQDSDRKEGSRRHVRNWGGADFDKVKAGMEKEKTWQGPGRRSSPKSGVPLDMTLSMTGRERAEYVRWKKEREQIDRERLARHRNPAGTWRREWDAEKSDAMFKEDPGLELVGEEEPKRPLPKPPTFGEFLVPPRGQRRRKSRGRGQGVGTKSYSMHDNRWEESEPPPEAEKQPVEEAPQDPPPALSPEEDEDQWEDVSEEEDEEEDEDWSEDEGPRSVSPPAQRPPKHHHVPPTTVGEVRTPPPSPFSPLGGHQPVSDWGEEMEFGDNPLLGPTGPKSRGETSGLSPPELTDPPGGAQTPLDSPPLENLQLKEEEEETLDKQEEAATENGTQGPFPDTTPGSVEITDFQRDPPAPRCPPVAPLSPVSLPP